MLSDRLELQCGREVGEMLLNLSKAWEQADTSTSNSIARQLPSLEGYLSGNAKSGMNSIIRSFKENVCCFL